MEISGRVLAFSPILEQTCSGLRRREVLRIGAVGGLGLSLPQRLMASETGGRDNDLSVLLVFLRGGVSHIDTWDMRPEAPNPQARGELKAIETNVSGIQMCELLPKLAQQADKISFLRGASHREEEHDNAMQLVLTGHGPGAGAVPFPNVGAVVEKYNPGRSLLPPAMHVGTPGLGNPMAPPAQPDQRGLSGGFLGAQHQPFMIPDVEKLDQLDWLRSTVLVPERLERRRDLLTGMDRVQERVESMGAEAHSAAYQRAFSIVTSPESKKSFNVDEEPRALRDRYGKHEFGQSCLLGRRLIEAGVRYVQVNWSARGWDQITKKDDLFTRSTFDSHFGHFPWLRRQLPRTDDGLAALLADMGDRGLLKKTLVVVLTEFGRAPGVNGDAGRDHWAKAFTVLMAGGPIQGGRVVGATDELGAEVTNGKFGPVNLLNQLYELCGLDVPVTLRQAGLVPGTSEGVPGLI